MTANNKKVTACSFLMMLPVIILISFLLFGMIICVLQAFGLDGSREVQGKNLFSIICSKDFAKSLIYTFNLAFIETTLSIVIAFVIAVYIIKHNASMHILYLPIAIPHIVVAMLIIQLFAQNGFISHMLHSLGLLKNSYDFISIVNDKYGIGIIIAYVWKSTAYALAVLYVILKKFNSDYYEISFSLGSSYKDYIFDILLPLSRNTLVFCFMVIFSYNFGAYELPFLLGSTVNRTIPILAYFEYLKPDFAAKVVAGEYNLVMLAIGMLFIILYTKLMCDESFRTRG